MHVVISLLNGFSFHIECKEKNLYFSGKNPMRSLAHLLLQPKPVSLDPFHSALPTQAFILG